jgi:hypothetical protein
MSAKQNILDRVSAHPKIVKLGIGLAITMAIGAAIGILEHSKVAFAYTKSYNNQQTNPYKKFLSYYYFIALTLIAEIVYLGFTLWYLIKYLTPISKY